MSRLSGLARIVPLALVAALAAPASAEDAEGAIMVTARKLDERLADVPVSVTVLDRAEIARANLRDMADIIRIMPNAAVSGGIAGALQGQVAVRGIATLVRNIGIESGVSTYVDGVFAGRPETLNQDLLDVTQVELLRGPQGTVFGKNTIAGVFNLTTGLPADTAEAAVRVDLGSYDLVRGQAMLSGPIGDGVGARLALGYSRRDGFYRHIAGGRDADSLDLFSWRGSIVLDRGGPVRLTLRTDGLRDRGVPGFFSQTDLAAPIPALAPRRIDANRPNRLDRDIAGGSATLEADLGAARLTSITAYRHYTYDAALDDDQRSFDFVAADLFGDRTGAVSQELRLTVPIGATVQALAGLYYLDQSSRSDRSLALGAAVVPGAPALTTQGRVTTKSYAAFASLDWRIVRALTLSPGVRYTHEVKRARFVQDDRTGLFTLFGLPDIDFAGRAADDDVSPTVTLRYALGGQSSAWVRVARGFKSAAFNVDVVSSASGVAAGPERATTYEAGVRTAGRVATASLSVFHTDYDDLQVAQVTGTSTVLANAARADVQGFEAEVALHPVEGLMLAGSVGHADGTYDQFDRCARPSSEGGGATDCAGKRLTGAPRWTARGSAEWRQPVSFGTVFVRADADHQSAVWFDPNNDRRFRAPARTLVGARIGVETGRFLASAWVENLTDRTYATYRDDRAALGVLRATAYGAPRTWGVTLVARL